MVNIIDMRKAFSDMKSDRYHGEDQKEVFSLPVELAGGSQLIPVSYRHLPLSTHGAGGVSLKHVHGSAGQVLRSLLVSIGIIPND